MAIPGRAPLRSPSAVRFPGPSSCVVARLLLPWALELVVCCPAVTPGDILLDLEDWRYFGRHRTRADGTYNKAYTSGGVAIMVRNTVRYERLGLGHFDGRVAAAGAYG